MGQQKEDIVLEFAPITKYRVRVLNGPQGRVLDVREYISNRDWEGYTRRGIRLTDRDQVGLLKDILESLLQSDLLQSQTPESQHG